MSILRNLCIAAILAILALASIPANAATPGYDAIYVFGDSYCDVGNVYTATAHVTPPAPYFNGRFSNGPIWVEHVASAWGLPMTASLLGGTDYAFGGALVTSDEVTPEGTIPSVPHQVDLYLSQHGGRADPNAIYVLEGGGNDILGAIEAGGISPQRLGYLIASEIAETEFILRLAGAQNFLIPDLLDVGQLPAASANPTFASSATVATNAALDQLLGYDGLLEGTHIYRLDVFGLFHDIAAAVTHFGFTNVTSPCLNPTECADPVHTLFWDAEHPTEFGHAFFAVTVEAVISVKVPKL